MEQKIAAFMNEQDLGSLEQGYRDDAPMPVLATPAAAVATCWYVGGAAAGAAAVVGAYVTGRVVG
ncbi:hypothetical protein ACPCIX_27830 [Streptomyces pseudogriseolus]|uniref:Uncharacterized protein n=4 Tax=Streptomyces TaxID=1883 RepID=M3DE97_STREZ|nr:MULTISPECIES: hypothetical protein [Streptomyces]MCM3297124.1 hypothetical protein [Streptomyces pseudogriseolus]GGQ01511.1 hypothetical protein GCM10010233_17060 [Streptomyces gancidicus]EMF28260.1 hypothetical protein H114_14913 [Streptomyces gancidicus BKS 13-15]MCI4142182.1 hypothetical protein [Streptomyces sp. MMS20-AI2-20]SHI10744.1 hypothetical protein SAMN05444521_4009 [Streptomyces sp. 3214.6]